jgi:hypothetical protein
MGTSRLLLLFGCALAASACTSIVEIRTEHSAVPVTSLGDARLERCVTGHRAPDEIANSLEDYRDFLIGYVEFNDQGWLYPSKEKGQPDQIQALVHRMRGDLVKYGDSNLVTLVFVHGWHHNARDNDCNVNEFRGMVERTHEVFSHQRPDGKDWRVVGVYVGWRGEAVDVPVLKYSTILDRRYAAEHVAKGSVRELFAELRQLELEHTGSGDRRVRTIISVRTERTWPDELLPRLQLPSGIFAGALERRQAELARNERLRFEALLSELSAVFSGLPAVILGETSCEW